MMVEVRDSLGFEEALKQFKRKISKDGIHKEIKARLSFVKRSERKKEKEREARKRRMEFEKKKERIERYERDHRAGKFEWSH